MKLILIVLMCVPVFGQLDTRTKLVLDSVSCTDMVGQRVIYAFKEDTASSKQYVLDAQNGYRVSLVCRDTGLGDSDSGNASVVSVLVTTEPLKSGGVVVVSHGVMFVGRDRADIMGRQLLANVDSSLSKFWDSVSRAMK